MLGVRERSIAINHSDHLNHDSGSLAAAVLQPPPKNSGRLRITSKSLTTAYSSPRRTLKTRADSQRVEYIMDDLYDEFGNFIGEEAEESEQESVRGVDVGNYVYDDYPEEAPEGAGQELMEVDGE